MGERNRKKQRLRKTERMREKKLFHKFYRVLLCSQLSFKQIEFKTKVARKKERNKIGSLPTSLTIKSDFEPSRGG